MKKLISCINKERMNGNYSLFQKDYIYFLIWEVFASLAFFSIFITACDNQSANPIAESLQPVPQNTGFRMEGYWVWGGSVIKVDSVYHMFASRWKKYREFPSDYLEHSEIVHATSKSLVGPYSFQGVVIGERDSVFWDSNMSHNPTITKIGDEYVLFYIGSDFTTPGVGNYPYLRRIGYATAKNIEGPWLRSEKPLFNFESNNPAVLIENGKVKMLFRDERLKVSLAVAEHYSGPFEVQNKDVWPSSRIEDFYLFKTGENYNFICEDNTGKISGHERWGVQFYSEDGINNWRTLKNVVAYNHDIYYTDGTVLQCTRRERPQLIIEDGTITGLATAVYTGTESWCQPVPLNPPLRLK